MQCEIDRDTMATDRSFGAGTPFGSQSSSLSLSRPTFGCHLCRAMECTGPDSTSVPCFRFVRRSAPTMRLGFAIWMNPSQAPGTSPSGWKCCRSPPHAHPIPGVPGIPPRALPEPAHISSNKVKRSRAWPLPADQPAIRPYRHLRRLSSDTYMRLTR